MEDNAAMGFPNQAFVYSCIKGIDYSQCNCLTGNGLKKKSVILQGTATNFTKYAVCVVAPGKTIMTH